MIEFDFTAFFFAKRRRLAAGRRVLALAAGLAALSFFAPSAHAESQLGRLLKAVTNSHDEQSGPPAAATSAPSAPAAAAPVAMQPVPVENGAQTTSATAPRAGEITGLATSASGGGSDSNLDLGKESDDNSLSATDLFKQPSVRKLLGEQPRFIYNPGNRPDPMLVPWVRNAAIFAELNGAAEEAVKNGKMDEAVALYRRIINMGDDRYTQLAQQKLQTISSAKNEAAAKALAESGLMTKIELPEWVTQNTTGVINDGQHSLALVGDDMVKEGEALPRYPGVKVARIEAKKVTYEIQGQKFEVPLKQD